ncbi:MAG: transposase, partial [Pseudomonadota bacterium]
MAADGCPPRWVSLRRLSSHPGRRCAPRAEVGSCNGCSASSGAITRPSLSDERVQLNAAGQVELKLKTPWRDGTTHLVMSPLEFMQRLAALVPRPRLHLIRLVSA